MTPTTSPAGAQTDNDLHPGSSAAGQAQITPLPEGAAAITISEQLEVLPHTLVTPHTTISIPNIATIAVVPIVQSRPSVVPILVVIAIVTATFSQLLPAPNATWQNPSPPDPRTIALVVGALACLAALIWRASPPPPHWRLLIGANDGSRTYFSSPSRDTLERVRKLLSDKIERREASITYNVNFASGDIQIVKEGASVGAIVTGSGNQVATEGARVGTTEINQSPGAQAGTGNVASGNIYPVDYSSVLQDVGDIKGFYAQQPQFAYIVERLAALEALLRTGTASPESRKGLGALLTDLAQIFNAVPTVVAVLRRVAQLGGIAL